MNAFTANMLDHQAQIAEQDRKRKMMQALMPGDLMCDRWESPLFIKRLEVVHMADNFAEKEAKAVSMSQRKEHKLTA